MPRRFKNWRRIRNDGLGWLCLVSAFLVGWIPGPGGLPLIHAGLNLLSIDNNWARRLKLYIIRHGQSLLDILFPDSWRWQVFWDLFVAATSLVGIWLLRQELHFVFDLAIGTGFYVNLIFFFRNRRRWQRFWRYLRRSA